MRLARKQTISRAADRRRAGGFTFAEVLAALVFMAIVIPVALEGLQIAGRAGTVAERKAKAVELGEALLNEMIVTKRWKDSSQNGIFETGAEGYRWVLRNTAWSEDAMRLLSLEVIFQVQQRDYSIELSTLIDSSQ
jgi:type II secretory pathway component PulJ